MHFDKNSKQKKVRRKVGALYRVIKWNPETAIDQGKKITFSQQDRPNSYPAEIVAPGNSYRGEVEIPYGSPVIYLKKLNYSECKVLYEDYICAVNQDFLSEESIQ